MKKFLFLLAFLPLISQTLYGQQTIFDSLISDGAMRYYHVYIPKNYITGSSRPLIIHLHGYASNGTLEQLYTNYMAVADTAGFLVAYPEGSLDNDGKQYWNVGWNGFPNTHNDVNFISNLIDQLHAKYNINLARVYASGLSNGGYLCYDLAWKLSNKIAAIASVSGSMYPPVFATCKPEGVVPVMEIHGTADGVVPYTSSDISTDIDSLLRFWVLADHCIPLAAAVSLPDLDPNDGSTVVHYEWSAELANTSCELYKIINGAHIDWPGAGAGNNMDFSATPTIWQFFNRYQTIQSSVPEKDESPVFSIYPNPCSSLLHLRTNHAGTVTIFDMVGRILLITTEDEIEISRLLPGIYNIMYENGGIRIIHTLVKL